VDGEFSAASVLSRKFVDNRHYCGRQAEGLSHEAAWSRHLRDRTLFVTQGRQGVHAGGAARIAVEQFTQHVISFIRRLWPKRKGERSVSLENGDGKL
jgi:hypothetical protein